LRPKREVGFFTGGREAPLKWSLADSCDSLSEGSREPEVIRLVKRVFLPRKSRNKENIAWFWGARQRLEPGGRARFSNAGKMASQEASAAEAQQADGMEVEQEETTLEESAVDKAEVAEGGGEGKWPEGSRHEDDIVQREVLIVAKGQDHVARLSGLESVAVRRKLLPPPPRHPPAAAERRGAGQGCPISTG
jgi:hypothetical protein